MVSSPLMIEPSFRAPPPLPTLLPATPCKSEDFHLRRIQGSEWAPPPQQRLIPSTTSLLPELLKLTETLSLTAKQVSPTISRPRADSSSATMEIRARLIRVIGTSRQRATSPASALSPPTD